MLRRAGLLNSLVLPFLAFVSAGCGKKEPKIIPVSGVVKVGGQPAANIAVRFMPDGQKDMHGPSSMAITDENGKFTLKCDNGQTGAAIGWHRVTLDDIAVDRPRQGQPQKNPPRIDGDYSLPHKALEVEVKEGGAEIVLEVPSAR